MYRDNANELAELKTQPEKNIICSIFGHSKKLKTIRQCSRDLNMFFIEIYMKKEFKLSITAMEMHHFAFASVVCKRCSTLVPVNRILNSSYRNKKFEDCAYLSYVHSKNGVSSPTSDVSCYQAWVGLINNKDAYCDSSQVRIISSMSDYNDLVNRRLLLPIKKKFGNQWRRAKLASEETVLYNIATHEMRLL